MKIEKGKTYSVSNMFKKSFIETNFYTNSEGRLFEREIGWRSGTMLICPVWNSEVEDLQEAVDAGEEFEFGLTLTDFSEHEFDSTWDGCWEDYSTGQEWSDELRDLYDKFYDETEEAESLRDDYFDFGSYMEEEHGFDMDDTECYISGPVLVEETEHQIEVDWEMYPEDEDE